MPLIFPLLILFHTDFLLHLFFWLLLHMHHPMVLQFSWRQLASPTLPIGVVVASLKPLQNHHLNRLIPKGDVHVTIPLLLWSFLDHQSPTLLSQHSLVEKNEITKAHTTEWFGSGHPCPITPMHFLFAILETPPLVSNISFHLITNGHMNLEATHNIIWNRLSTRLEFYFLTRPWQRSVSPAIDTFPYPTSKKFERAGCCTPSFSRYTQIGVMKDRSWEIKCIVV